MKETRYLKDYPDVLTPDEAMVILGIGKNKIYTILKDGSLQALRIGKLYRIPKESLVRYISSCYNNSRMDDLPTTAQKGA